MCTAKSTFCSAAVLKTNSVRRAFAPVIKFPQNHKIIHNSVRPLKDRQTNSNGSKVRVLFPTVACSWCDT